MYGALKDVLGGCYRVTEKLVLAVAVWLPLAALAVSWYVPLMLELLLVR